MKALVDGDLICFRSAASAEKEEQHIAIARADELLRRILARVSADSYTVYISGGSNFRKEIDPNYKANRTQPKPIHLAACQEHLIKEWQAVVTDGIEADDALGIAQTNNSNTVICSLDKDLLQIPGKHYQWDISGMSTSGRWEKPEQFYDITPEEGLKRFWTQMLVGDKADNITGVYGIGPKKAEKLLGGAALYSDLESLDALYYSIVSELYDDPVRMHRNAKCLWILRNEAQVWQSPEERVKHDEEEASSLD